MGKLASLNSRNLPDPDAYELSYDMDHVRVVSLHSQRNPLLTPTQRLIFGIFILLVVDVIWVASSELSKYIFQNEKFDKPFFTTYTKTSMFAIFLLGFLFWTPWQDRCCAPAILAAHNPYTLLASSEAEASSDTETFENDGDENTHDEPLSSPAFVPINCDTGSGTESDDLGQKRSVRFSKLAEVRHMSECEAAEALFSRLSYEASLQAEQVAYNIANRLSPGQTAQLALTFCLLWFFANYAYQLALSNSQVGIVNVLSCTSSLFTLILASIFPSVVSDKFTLSKLLTVFASMLGIAVISLSDVQFEQTLLPIGALFAVLSAFFYAVYLVFLRKKVDHEDRLDIPMFFGFVGLFNLCMLWPLFFLIEYTGVEEFVWPTKRQWIFITVNGLVGTVLSEVLWLWGCFLTSSLIATLAISLTIPLSMLADVMFKRVTYSYHFYLGCLPILMSFFGVALLTHYENWDPVTDMFRKCFRKFRIRRRTSSNRIVREDRSDQNDRLIEDGFTDDCEQPSSPSLDHTA